MLGQAVGVPLPSEVMLSFGGYLASTHMFVLAMVILAGTAGDTAGAIVAYFIGYYGGRPFLLKFGRLFFVRAREIDRADRWFARYGSRAVLICKLLPGVRALGSYPAGVTHMSFAPFLAYTFAGSLIWSIAFSELGFFLGKNWETLATSMRPLSLILLALLLVGIVVWIWVHFRAERTQPSPKGSERIP